MPRVVRACRRYDQPVDCVCCRLNILGVLTPQLPTPGHPLRRPTRRRAGLCSACPGTSAEEMTRLPPKPLTGVDVRTDEGTIPESECPARGMS
jgi:hypothetical protein